MTTNTTDPFRLAFNQINVAAATAKRLQPLFPIDRPVWQAHTAINARGVRIDRPLLSAAAALVGPIERELLARLRNASGGTITAQILLDANRFPEAIRMLGVPITTRAVGALRRNLAKLDDGVAKLAIATYLFQHQIEHARFGKILQRAGADDHLRGLYEYAGAHPGRWSSLGVNAHSLTKTGMKPVMIAQVIEAVLRRDVAGVLSATGQSHAHECLAGLIRAAFIPDDGYLLAVADLSQIELRILLYLAGDQEALAQFEHVDMHVRMAEFVFKESLPKDDPRYDDRRNTIGKITNLGCGFGLGPSEFERKCREDWGIDLAAYHLTGQHVIDAYHKAYPLVRRTWNRHQYAAVTALRTRQPFQFGPVTWSVGNQGLMAVLPSGRPLIFHEARPVPGKFNPTDEQIEYTKFGRDGSRERVTAWGGTLVQNLCEAIGRDLIAHNIVACEAEDLPVVLHTHDEVAALVPEANAEEHLARLKTIFETAPNWCTGKLPLKAEPFLTTRYGKKPMR